MKDKVTISITIERNPNGTVGTSSKMEGEGFHYFEIIGLLELYKLNLAKQSLETAKELSEVNQDRPTRITFKSEDNGE